MKVAVLRFCLRRLVERFNFLSARVTCKIKTKNKKKQ